MKQAAPKNPKSATLHFSSRLKLGIHREKRGKNFIYRLPNGKLLSKKSEIARIKSLAIPPAYQDVWISPDPKGHIQAVGRDARKRLQYRYHPKWRELRDQSKYNRTLAFAKALPSIRRHTANDLRRSGLDKRKVVAAVVQLLEKTLIRVGNDEYARTNKSYGLTTLQDRHVKVKGAKIHFVFRGKSGVNHTIDLEDKRLSRIVKNCQDLPGYDLFQYRGEDGKPHDIVSQDINEYLHEVAGEEFTAKDFRTWAGTVLAAKALHELQIEAKGVMLKSHIVKAVESVSKKLGNTKAICRKCYVHPAIFESYLDGSLSKALNVRADRMMRDNSHALRPSEAAVLALLRTKISSARRAHK